MQTAVLIDVTCEMRASSRAWSVPANSGRMSGDSRTSRTASGDIAIASCLLSWYAISSSISSTSS